MSETEKDQILDQTNDQINNKITETAGYITMPVGKLYYKTYEKKCDTQGKSRLPVVLLHGNRGTHRDFSSYIKVLTDAGCLVIAMDSRGHGASVLKTAALKAAVLKTGKRQKDSIRRKTGAAYMAEDVVRLLDYLKIGKAVILGFSDGANTALEFAVDYPERAKKITAPVLLMAGPHDLIKESHTRFIAKCIPQSCLVLIKGGTHQGFFKKKERYTGTILDFLFDEKKLDKTN